MGLDEVPAEILRRIVSFAGFRAAIRLSYMSHFFHDALTGPDAAGLWKTFFIARFPESEPSDLKLPEWTGNPWMELFKTESLKRCFMCGQIIEDLRNVANAKNRDRLCFLCYEDSVRGERIYD